MGYLIEIANNIARPYVDNLNMLKNRILPTAQDIKLTFRLNGIDNLQNEVDALNLIQQVFDDWQLEIDARMQYNDIIQENTVNHGIISSLSVLWLIDLMYQYKNPNREYEDIIENNINYNQRIFENEIVPACAAIFLHNLPNELFLNNRIDAHQAPLPFLLKLSDILQEWERPSQTNPRGFHPEQFTIRINQNIEYYANIPPIKKEEIQYNLHSTLVIPNIIIQ